MRKKRILILDDSSDDIFLIKREISKLEPNIIFFSAYTIESAIEQFEICDPDMVFVDYYLGNNTGIDLVMYLRNLEYVKPIILITGSNSEKVLNNALDKGVDGYIHKDIIDKNQLARVLRIN